MSDDGKKPEDGLMGQARDLARKALTRAAEALERVSEAAEQAAERLDPTAPAPGPDAAHPAGDEATARAAALDVDAPTGRFLHGPPADHERPGREWQPPTVPLAWVPTSPTAMTPVLPGAPPREPFGMLDLEEPPETYAIDEVAVLARDPYTLFAYWEVTDEGRAAARAALGGDGLLVLRLHVAPPGGATELEDHVLGWDHGRRYLPASQPGAWISAAVGLRAPDGRFAPIAHSPRARVPHAEPGPDVPVEWMEVEPARTRGARPEPPRIVQRGPATEVRGAPTAFRRGATAGAWASGAWGPAGAARPGAPASAAPPGGGPWPSSPEGRPGPTSPGETSWPSSPTGAIPTSPWRRRS